MSPLPSGVDIDRPKDRAVDENASYLWVEAKIGYQGHTREEFLRWETEEVAATMAAWKGGLILDGWKSVATFPLTVYYIVYQETAAAVDDVMFQLPLFVNNGENIITKITPIREGKFLAQKLRQLSSS